MKIQTQVADYRAGKEKLLGFFVGQVMKETGASVLGIEAELDFVRRQTNGTDVGFI